MHEPYMSHNLIRTSPFYSSLLCRMPVNCPNSSGNLGSEMGLLLGSVFGRTDSSRIFIFGLPDLVAGFFSPDFCGENCAQKNPPGKSPANPPKFTPQKSPTHFCRGAGPNVALCHWAWSSNIGQTVAVVQGARWPQRIHRLLPSVASQALVTHVGKPAGMRLFDPHLCNHCQEPNKGINIKNLGRNPPSQTPPPQRNPWPPQILYVWGVFSLQNKGERPI